MLRPLRIAVSVVSGICCVLMIVLWVRSYWRRDLISGHTTNRWFVIESVSGHVALMSQNDASGISTTWRFDSWGPHTRRFGVRINDHLVVRYWSLAFSFAVLAVTPWLSALLANASQARWRFSLRTLLIATTLVAAVLGLIVYMMR